MAVTTTFWLDAWGVGFVNVTGHFDQPGQVFYDAALARLRGELQARQGAPLGEQVRPVPLRTTLDVDGVTTVTYKEEDV